MRLRDIAWNLLGLGAPAVVAAVSIPAIIDLISLERFGLLALVWGATSFSGLFDLGIGRATTQWIARERAAGNSSSVSVAVGTAMRLSIAFGTVGTIVIATLVALGAYRLIKFDAALADEVMWSGYLLALVIPIQTVSATLRGINEAFEKFKGISIVRIAAGVSTFAGPLLTAQFTPSLCAATAALLAARVASACLFGRLARQCLAEGGDTSPYLSMRQKFDRILAMRLLKFGGWVTVTAVVYPLMMQADRFLIGSKVSSTAVANYTIPYELVMQLLTVIGAVTTVAFPRLSALEHTDEHLAKRLFRRMIVLGSLSMAVAALLLGLFMDDLLRLWLHNRAGAESTLIGRILCLGLVPYAIGSMLVSRIHARGRADITGKAHLIQAPIYMAALAFAIEKYGSPAAAWLWTIRVVIDTLMLTFWKTGLPRSNSSKYERP